MEWVFLFIIFLNAFLLAFCVFTFSDKYSKVLAANCFTTNFVVLIVFFAFYMKEESVLDMAIIYTLISFVTMIGIAKFIKASRSK